MSDHRTARYVDSTIVPAPAAASARGRRPVAPLFSDDTRLAIEIRDLVERGAADEARERFAALVAAHQRRALRIAYQYLRDPADADEAVQDAFFKVFLHISSYREAWPFEVWFTRILINGCLDRRKARARRDRWFVPAGEASAADEARLAGGAEDTLILLEHPPVFTAGRRWKPEHIVWTQERIRAAGAGLRFIDRGGSLTFHGPGQLVGYPVLDLGTRPDALGFVRRLEEVVIRAAADIGVALQRNDIQTGVWSGTRKVAAIGVRLMRMRITLHGFALNCTTDLSWYDAIVPCGLSDEGVTSLSELTGREVTVTEMAPLVARRFEDVFDTRLEHEEAGWSSPRASIAAVSAS